MESLGEIKGEVNKLQKKGILRFMENENAIIENGELVSPREIDKMNDEEFDAYIESAKEGGEVQAAEDSGDAEPAEDAEQVPYMSFNSKEELQEYQDRTIGDRLREIREAGESERRELANISELARARYGIENDADAISSLIAELEEQNASDSGMTPGEYSLSREIKALGSRLNYENKVDEIQNEWLRQSEALKRIVPNFDIEEAFRNPEFYRQVVYQHRTLAEAYPALAERPKRRTISEIGNLTNGVCGSVKHDVASMSDREFDDYIKKIKNS